MNPQRNPQKKTSAVTKATIIAEKIAVPLFAVAVMQDIVALNWRNQAFTLESPLRLPHPAQAART